MIVDKNFRQLDPEELLLLLVVLPAERCVHLLLQLSILSDEAKLTTMLKRLSDWEVNGREPLKALFALPMGLNLLDYLFGEQYLPDTAPSGELYWSYMFNGCRKTGEIIGALGSGDAVRIVTRIQAAEPELWARIKEQVFLWEDVCRLTDDELSLVLQELPGALVQDEMLTAFLSAQETTVCSRLLRNLPDSRKAAVWHGLQKNCGDAWRLTLVPELYQREIRGVALKQIRDGRIKSPNAAATEH